MTGQQKARLLMLAAVAVWGSTFVLVKNALTDVSPLLFNLIRMTLGFLCLAILYRRHWAGLTRRAWAGGALVGFFLAVGYEFQTAGLRWTTPSKSAFLTGLTVVIVPLLAALPGLHPPATPAPRWNAWLGALLAFAGIVMLTTPPASGADPRSLLESLLAQFASVNRGDLLSIACAFGFSLQIIAQNRFSRPSGGVPAHAPVPFKPLAMLQIGFAALFMAVTTPWIEKPHLRISVQAVVALAVTAVLATALAFAIQSYAQHLLPPAQLVLLVALEPVFAWLTSLALLGEGLSGRATLGAGLILAGMAAAELIRTERKPTQTAGQLIP
ncbi:MAG TPA: DMT family transporter [Acidobacteriaceae bacterium]|nr:DMT family transporter [Acidobacteriaceae bacterium]